MPKVLHRIGQVSATPMMAIPVLELLMSIIGLPSLYNGFVEKQYLGVFGIAIPYTDHSKYIVIAITICNCSSFFLLFFLSKLVSFRYNLYVTALAHHVVSMWFIRCRIQYRPTVAKFINKVS